jgi:glutaconate CoA-transferase subunit A
MAMRGARWVGLEELGAAVFDGASIAPGGFMLGRAPMALVRAIIGHGRRGLHVVSLPNPFPAEVLVAAGAVARLDFAFGALTLGGRVRALPCLRRAMEEGRIEWREHDGYRIVQRLRAAAMGVPFLPVPDADQSDLAALEPLGWVDDPFNGGRVPVERAFSPEFALVHAHAADDAGNLFIEDPTTDVLVASAARRLLATAERRVRSLPRVTIPAFQVTALAEAPGGALPTGCVGLYPHDAAALERWCALAEAQRIDELLRLEVQAA